MYRYLNVGNPVNIKELTIMYNNLLSFLVMILLSNLKVIFNNSHYTYNPIIAVIDDYLKDNNNGKADK